jgi:hypothetical protein
LAEIQGYLSLPPFRKSERIEHAHSRREITFVFAALAEQGSRARFVRWLTDRLGSPTHYKPVQLQYSGGLTIRLIGSTPRGTWPSLFSEKGSGLHDRNTASNKRRLRPHFPSNHRWNNYFPLWNAKTLSMVWRLGNQENA